MLITFELKVAQRPVASQNDQGLSVTVSPWSLYCNILWIGALKFKAPVHRASLRLVHWFCSDVLYFVNTFQWYIKTCQHTLFQKYCVLRLDERLFDKGISRGWWSPWAISGLADHPRAGCKHFYRPMAQEDISSLVIGISPLEYLNMRIWISLPPKQRISAGSI